MFLDVQRKAGKVFTFYASVDAQWSRKQYLKAYRCNAARLDELIVAALSELLCDRLRLRSALKPLGLHGPNLEKLAELGEAATARIEKTAPDKVGRIVRALISEIEVGQESVAIVVRPAELKRFLEWDDNSAFRARERDWPLSDAKYIFEIEVRVTAAEKWPNLNVKPRDATAQVAPDRSLIQLIESARTAQRMMDEHRDLAVPELARMRRMRPSQFARLIRINYLAPDIVASILDGTQPDNLTRRRLLAANIPTDWALQRRLFCFPVPRRVPATQKTKGMWPTSKALPDTPSTE